MTPKINTLLTKKPLHKEDDMFNHTFTDNKEYEIIIVREKTIPGQSSSIYLIDDKGNSRYFFCPSVDNYRPNPQWDDYFKSKLRKEKLKELL